MKLSFPCHLLLCGLTFGGCASLNCATAAPGGEPAIELAYVGGGDAPTVTLLRVFSGTARTPDRALLEIEPLGLRRSCRLVHGPRVLEIKAVLKGELSNRLQEEAKRGGFAGFDDPLLGIRSLDFRFQRPLPAFTPSLLEALSPIEALFVGSFPRLTARLLPFRIGDLANHSVTANPSLQRATTGHSPGCRR